MAGHNDLRDGAHPNCIASDVTEVLVLCGSLIGRACAAHVNAFLEFYPEFFGKAFRQPYERRVIRTRHIRETRADFIEIRADKRVWQEVDVVLYDHKVPHVEAKVGAACGIGNEKVLDSHHQHYADGKYNHIHTVALIVVDAALHCNDLLSGKRAGDVIALMARCGGHREARKILVRHRDGVFYGIGK